MEPDIKSLFAIGLAAVICLVFVLRHLMLRRWVRQEQEAFIAALSSLNISHFELLLDRTVFPSRLSRGEVYRIIHNHADEYFLYLHTRGSPGVLQPLSKEQAMIAVELNS